MPEWKGRFDFTCKALRNFRNGLDAWIERANNDRDSIRIVEKEGRPVIENSVKDVSTSDKGTIDQVAYFASVFTAFAKLLSQREICAEFEAQILDKRNYEKYDRAVKAIARSSPIRLFEIVDSQKMELHRIVSKRRHAMQRTIQAGKRMNDLIAAYLNQWGVNPMFAPTPIAIGYAASASESSKLKPTLGGFVY